MALLSDSKDNDLGSGLNIVPEVSSARCGTLSDSEVNDLGSGLNVVPAGQSSVLRLVQLVSIISPLRVEDGDLGSGLNVNPDLLSFYLHFLFRSSASSATASRGRSALKGR